MGVCVKCKYIVSDMIESPNSDDIIPFEKKCLYVGLQMPSKITMYEKRITLGNIDLFLSKLHVICPEDLYNYIINNSPKPYPLLTRITKLNSEKYALYDRRFETSMLCYNVSNCDCFVEKIVLIIMTTYYKRKHVLLKDLIYQGKHKISKCCCSNICSGEQFY